MYWQETSSAETFVVPKRVLDLSFRIDCEPIPVDHAQLLADAILPLLEWLPDDPAGGIHPIFGGQSGNGWERPDEPSALIYPSRRTPLTIRISADRLDSARQLEGKSLRVGEANMKVGDARERLLQKTETLYCRQLSGENLDDEDRFIADAVFGLKKMGLEFKKVLCGKTSSLRTATGQIGTRSLMVSGLSLEHAVQLQESGLGPHRLLGCGLFIPHKSI